MQEITLVIPIGQQHQQVPQSGINSNMPPNTMFRFLINETPKGIEKCSFIYIKENTQTYKMSQLLDSNPDLSF